jgi:aminopeptidase YwaD
VDPTTDLDPLAGRLRRHVVTLAATPRPPRSPAHAAAAGYVRDHLTRAGFRVTEERSEQGGEPCVNLLAAPLPDRPELPLFIVGAHYDSLPHTPGADDNASAVAALLELAAWVRPHLERATARLQLVAYDLEELGLLGSAEHCRGLRAAGVPVLGMVSLEMLGYADSRPGSQNLPPGLAGLYPDVADFIGVVGNEASGPLLGTVAQGMRTVPGLPVEQLAVPGRGEMVPDVRRSDHASFWDAGHPAVMVTDTSFFRNPHYHQPTDTPDTLDYLFLARVTLGVAAAVRRLLGV